MNKTSHVMASIPVPDTALSDSAGDCLPVPDTALSDSAGDCRLWIGNLDPRVTEFVLLKILQKYGELKKFDFLYHKSGPDQGKSRGYCFATYKNRNQAENARKKLNGKIALSKPLAVRWAHAEKDEEERPQNATGFHRLCEGSSQRSRSQIQEIEAKLRSMDDSQKDFTLSFKPSAPAGSNKVYSVNNSTVKKQTKPYRHPRKR